MVYYILIFYPSNPDQYYLVTKIYTDPEMAGAQANQLQKIFQENEYCVASVSFL